MRSIRMIVSGLLVTCGVDADPGLAPPFAVAYEISTLDAPVGVPGALGGLTFLEGEPETLLIAGDAGTSGAALYAVDVMRGPDGHIIGFDGRPSIYAAAPSGADGGVGTGVTLFGVNFIPLISVVVYTTPDGWFGVIEPGEPGPAAIQDLPAALDGSPVTQSQIPCGLPGCTGRIKFLSEEPARFRDGGYFISAVGCGPSWWDCLLVFPLDPVVELDGRPRSMAFIDGSNPVFDGATVLIAKAEPTVVDAYLMDDIGHPIPESKIPFITDLEGAAGMTIDPVTHDLIITRNPTAADPASGLVIVRGFDPCPTADLDDDCLVNAADLAQMLAAWGDAEDCDTCNLNCDWHIDESDLAILLSQWTVTP